MTGIPDLVIPGIVAGTIGLVGVISVHLHRERLRRQKEDLTRIYLPMVNVLKDFPRSNSPSWDRKRDAHFITMITYDKQLAMGLFPNRLADLKKDMRKYVELRVKLERCDKALTDAINKELDSALESLKKEFDLSLENLRKEEPSTLVVVEGRNFFRETKDVLFWPLYKGDDNELNKEIKNMTVRIVLSDGNNWFETALPRVFLEVDVRISNQRNAYEQAREAFLEHTYKLEVGLKKAVESEGKAYRSTAEEG